MIDKVKLFSLPSTGGESRQPQKVRGVSPRARVRVSTVAARNPMPSNALDYVTIKGFKSIASLDKLELRPINILIGPNGSGKSNFIGAFSFLHEIREGRLQEYVTSAGGAERVLHFGSKTTKEVSFHLSFKNQVNQYALKLSPTEDDSLFPSEEYAYDGEKPSHSSAKHHVRKVLEGLPEKDRRLLHALFIEDRDKDEVCREFKVDRNYLRVLLHRAKDSIGLSPRRRRLEAGISNPDLEGAEKWVRDRLGSWRIYHIHDTSSTSPMRKTAKLDDNDFLRSDGSNLAAFLYYLREAEREAYRLIQRTIQRVAPFFDDFRLKPLRLKSDNIKLEWRHKSSDEYFDAASLSDGTLRFVALATLFLQPLKYRPSAILVDEPELGLHPYAIGMLASLIGEASVDTQVIVSTQSSLLLDHFQPEDVLVANRVAAGTELTRPDPGKLAKWLEEYSLGQLWEKNEIGGRPMKD